MTIGESFKTIRNDRKISQKQLAKLSGVSVAMISYIEADRRIPTVLTAKKIAQALRCTIDELVGDAEEPACRAS